MQNTSGVHILLLLSKAFRAMSVNAQEGLSNNRTGLCDSDFKVLEVLLHKGPLPVNAIGPKVWLTPGSISVAVDRLEEKGLVKRGTTDDRRVRLVELTARGRALIEKAFSEYKRVAEEAAAGLSKDERSTLVQLLKQIGRHAEAASRRKGALADLEWARRRQRRA